jgi:peptidoglycan glycosyltransferase
VAGKTGSAEYSANGYDGTHSWFVGFSNVENPDLVVVVIAEDGGTGSSTAVPIAAQVFQTYYSIYGY